MVSFISNDLWKSKEQKRKYFIQTLELEGI